MRSELPSEGKGGSSISDPLALFFRQGGSMLNAFDVWISKDHSVGCFPSSTTADLSVTSALAEPNFDEKCECAYNIFNPAYIGQSTEPRTDPCVRQFL